MQSVFSAGENRTGLAGLRLAWARVLAVAGLMLALAVSARAQLDYPQLLSLSRESAASARPGDVISYRVGTQAGTAPIASVTLFFAAPNTVAGFELSSTDAASGRVSAPADPSWPNARYNLSSIRLVDTWGRSVIYSMNSSETAAISASPPAYYAGPLDSPFFLPDPALALEITGAGGPYPRDQLTELELLTSGTLSPGATARVRYTLTPGATPATRMILSFRTTGGLVHSVTRDLPARTGEVTFPIVAEMVNARYDFISAGLYYANGDTLAYGTPAARTVFETTAAATRVIDLPYPNLGSTASFSVSGAGTTAAVPQLTTWTRDSAAEVSVGSTVKFSYGTAATTSFAVNLVTLQLTGPYGATRTVTSAAASGSFTLPVQADWTPGPYKVSRVSVADTAGRAAGYASGGAVTVSTGTTRPGAHTFPDSAFEFTVSGTPIATYFIRQPRADTRAMAGSTVTLAAQAVGLGATTRIDWFRGEPGDTSTPITAGVQPDSSGLSYLTVTVQGPATYWARATSGSVSTASTAARVAVAVAPRVAVQPQGQIARIGGTVSFTVTAEGDGPFTYYWKGVNALSTTDYNARTVQFTVARASDAGAIICEITGPGGTVTTQPALLTVLAGDVPLHFIREPEDQVIASGSSLFLNATFAGNPPLRYRWQKDGVDVASGDTTAVSPDFAGSATLSSSQTAGDPAGVYRLIVTNGFETLYSRDIRVSSTRLPIFREQPPATYSTVIDSLLRLSVSTTSLTPVSFQWRRNGAPLAGATAAELLRFNLSAADAGAYDVVVTNAAGSVTSSATQVAVGPAPSEAARPGIAQGPVDRTAFVGETVTFTVTPTGDNRRCVWYKDSRVLQDSTATSLTIGPVAASDTGNYRILVGTPTGASAVRDFKFTVVARQDAPVVIRPPVDAVVPRGETAQLRVAVDGRLPMQFRWRFNGVPITNSDLVYGTDESVLSVTKFDSTRVGRYDVVVTNSAGTVTSTAATLSLPPPGPEGRLMNVSVRAPAGGAAGTLILGFVIGGGTPEDVPLLLRAAGPALTGFGVTGVLANPTATLYRGSGPRLSNDDWAGFTPIATAAARVGAFPFSTTATRDAALLASLAAGPYTFHVNSTDATGGTALAEIYDATTAAEINLTRPRLLNLSVQTRADGAVPVIVGFALGGTQSRSVLIRAIGPGLTPFGVTGVLADPQLALYRGSTRLQENNDWGGTPALRTAFSAVGAFDLTSATSKDAALVATLTPGPYTVQVTGAAGTSGAVLIEIYEVP